MVGLDVRGDRPLADGGGPGEDDEAAPPVAWAGLGPARVEVVLQRAALARAESAELLHRRDLELLQDAVALALADGRDAGEELGHPHRARGGLRIRQRTAQQLLRRDDAHRDILLQGCPFATRSDGATGCCDAVDFWWPRRRTGGLGRSPIGVRRWSGTDTTVFARARLDDRAEPLRTGFEDAAALAGDDAAGEFAEAEGEIGGPGTLMTEAGREDRSGRS